MTENYFEIEYCPFTSNNSECILLNYIIIIIIVIIIIIIIIRCYMKIPVEKSRLIEKECSKIFS